MRKVLSSNSYTILILTILFYDIFVYDYVKFSTILLLFMFIYDLRVYVIVTCYRDFDYNLASSAAY